MKIFFILLLFVCLNVEAEKMKAYTKEDIYFTERRDTFSPTIAYDMYQVLAIGGNDHAQLMAYIVFQEFPTKLESKVTEAINFLASSARNGNSISQYNLGLILTKGFFLDKNIFLANQWLEKSALAGEIDAAALLGINLSKEFLGLEGSDEKSNILLNKAIKFLEIGMVNDDLDVINTLAIFYHKELGEPDKAIKLLKQAVELGDPEATALIDRIKVEVDKENKKK